MDELSEGGRYCQRPKFIRMCPKVLHISMVERPTYIIIEVSQ